MSFLSCKEAPEKSGGEIEEHEKIMKIDHRSYPEVLNKIFDAHGGLDTWRAKRTISFEIPKPDKSEKHTIDLYSRNEKIEMAEVAMGSDSSGIWLLDENEEYKGDPIFYHNLMFYFYTMPFIVSDAGINYGETEALEFEGELYPGIRISYDVGIGLSSKDEYFLHYNPETFQMEWLGYTVTYRSGEKSDNIKWIRYNDWMKVDGLILPKSLTWHEYEGRTIKEARAPLNFNNVALSETAKSPNFFFSKPEKAKSINRKME